MQPPLGNLGLHEKASRRLRSLILSGELPPGTELVETSLSTALGISRTPVREALKLLGAEGLVELRANRSPRVPELHAEAILQLFEAMAGIERIAAELAASRMDEEELAHLHTLQSKMENHYQAEELGPYFDVNQQIHRLIVAGSHNQSLRDAHEILYGRAELVRRRALGVRRRWDESVTEHRAILVALTARDPAMAGALLGGHVERTGSAVVESISQIKAGASDDR